MAQEILTIPLPWTNSPVNLNDRDQHYVKAKKVAAALAEARGAVAAAKVPAVERGEVVLHLQLKDRRRRDADNLAGTLKVVQDALVQEGVLVDDGWQHVPFSGQKIHGPKPSAPARMWIEITVLEYADDALI